MYCNFIEWYAHSLLPLPPPTSPPTDRLASLANFFPLFPPPRALYFPPSHLRVGKRTLGSTENRFCVKWISHVYCLIGMRFDHRLVMVMMLRSGHFYSRRGIEWQQQSCWAVCFANRSPEDLGVVGAWVGAFVGSSIVVVSRFGFPDWVGAFEDVGWCSGEGLLGHVVGVREVCPVDVV